MSRRTLQVQAFLRAIYRIVALHLALRNAVAVGVLGTLDQNARVPEVARRLHG